jgi:hypothetical protein
MADNSNMPEIIEGWLRMYPTGISNSQLYPSQEAALDNMSSNSVIACIHVKFQKGQGLVLKD